MEIEKRIAAGSGTGIPEVNKLIKQFEDMRKMMKMMTTGNIEKYDAMPGMRR